MASESIEEYFIYNAKWQVIICKGCRYCPAPGKSLARHLMDEHQSIPLDTRKELITWAETLDLVEPDRVMVPNPNTPPIKGLKLNEEGYKCEYIGCIDPYTGTITSMKEHCKKKHGWISTNGIKWTKLALQTFFHGKYRKYFDDGNYKLIIVTFL